jgi:hypothetical protein
MSLTGSNHVAALAQFTGLIDELLDAHCDTVCLASDVPADDPAWAAHLDYLRALGRVGHRTLADVGLAGS